MNTLKIVIVAALALAGFQAKAEPVGFPQFISFEWSQPTATYRATGPMTGYAEQSPYCPQYDVDFRVGNSNREGVLTLEWSFPDNLSFTFLNRHTGSTCPGYARSQNGVYVGSMSCQSGTYPVTIR